jgi:hypothetical protein
LTPHLKTGRTHPYFNEPRSSQRRSTLPRERFSPLARLRPPGMYALRQLSGARAGLCNVAKGWAGCCIIIIKKPRNLAEVAGGRLDLCKDTMLLANAQVSPNIAWAVDW